MTTTTTAPPCPICGHQIEHWLSGACKRSGCTRCPQSTNPTACPSCGGTISAAGYCRCSGLGG